MQLTCTQRQGSCKEHIGTWKLLQVVHKELLCNKSFYKSGSRNQHISGGLKSRMKPVQDSHVWPEQL